MITDDKNYQYISVTLRHHITLFSHLPVQQNVYVSQSKTMLATHVFISLLLPEATWFHINTFYFFFFCVCVWVSKVLPKKTCQLFSATNYLDNCFFCDKSHGKLYSCTTKSLNKHVNEWAVYKQDSKLLGKLSEGIWQPQKPNTTKTALQICPTNSSQAKKCSSSEGTIINYRRYLYTIFKVMCS